MKIYFCTCLLLLLAKGAIAAEPTIDGFYRYGPEVNAVCFGEPEACYWLVDTDRELRAQLQQRVSGLAPYTAVCVRMKAVVSAKKAAGFGSDYDGSIRVVEIIGACDEAAVAEEQAAVITRLENLQHRRWVLEQLDGIELAEFAHGLGFDIDELSQAKQPDLDFGAQGFVAGNTGCNQFEGQAQVVDNQLLLSQLAVTAMHCAGFAGELELQLQLLYRNPLDISFDGSALILRANERELRYRLRDWVQ